MRFISWKPVSNPKRSRDPPSPGPLYQRPVFLTCLCLTLTLLLLGQVVEGQASSKVPPPPDSLESYLSLASKAFITSDYKNSLIYYDKALALEPTNYLTLFRRAVVYSTALHIPQAIQDFTHVLQLNPNYHKALFQRAKMYLMQGSLQLALEDLEAYARTTPNDAHTSDLIQQAKSAQESMAEAKRQISAGNTQEAITAYSAVISTCPYDIDLRTQRANVYVAAGLLEAAISDYSRVVKMRPDSTPIMLKLSELYLKIGELEPALQSIKECLKIDHDNKACKGKFRGLKNLLKAYKSAQTFEASSNWPKLTSLLTQQEKALIPQVEKLNSSSLNFKVYAMACKALGETEKSDKTISWCTKALNIDGTYEDGYFYRATAKLTKELYEEAIADLKKAQESNTQSQRLNDALNRAQRLLKLSKQKDYYKVLDVPRSANKKDIKKAFRKLAQIYHPDKYRGELKAEQVQKKMAAVNEAYEVLSDEELRARFDNGEDPNDPDRNNQHQQYYHHQGGGGFGGGDPFGGQFGGGGGSYHFHYGG